MRPRVVKATENPNTKEINYLKPVQEPSVPIVDEHNWDEVIDAMKDVAHFWRGTAYRIGKDSKYKLAGKTGTAQVFTVGQDEEYEEGKLPRELKDHALFIAFAPVENPQIAVSVIVEHGGHGGSTAAPIAKKVMDHYLLPMLDSLQKKPEEPKPDSTKKEQS